jgi:hypothetical protein
MALVRQTLVESAVTALAGGGLGVLIAAAATRALVAISPQELPRLQSVGTDLPVLAFGLLAAGASACAACSSPARSPSPSS